MKTIAIALTLVSFSAHAKVSETECNEMKSKVGQLFYINVDGFGSNFTIHPAYEKLVKKIQPGGVLPHYNSKDITAISTASAKLQAQSDLPLMIGIDYQSVNGTEMGLGWGTGLADKLGDVDKACFKKVGEIEAALHKYAGINNPLGPTVEYNLKSGDNGFAAKDLQYKKERLQALMGAFKDAGLETTLKHFPYTPADYNLHKKSEDTKIPQKEVDEVYMPIYKELAGQSGMLMTTHLYNSEVDPANMATFSKIWMNKLRNEVGFKGLAMTDALFMINSYPETMKQMRRDWPKHLQKDFDRDLSRFAIKSILAGHDMVFLETPAKETEEVYNDLTRFACTDDDMAKDFRTRVRESYKRITAYKKENPQLKLKPSTITPEEVKKLIAARKKGKEICNENFAEIEKIVAKSKGKKTKIDKTVFCDPFTFDQGQVSEALKKMDENVNVNILKSLILGSMNNQDDYNASVNYLGKNPEVAKKLFGALKQDFFNGDKAKRDETLEAMARLGFLDKDSDVIDDFLLNGSYEDFKSYMKLAETNNLAPVSDKVPLEKRIPFFQKYNDEYSLDLLSEKPEQRLLTINEMLFPSKFFDAIDPEKLKEISPSGDKGLLFKLRAANRSAIELSPEENARVLEAYTKNQKLYNYKLTTTYCSKYGDNGCEEEEQNETDMAALATSISPDKMKLIPEETKQKLIQEMNLEYNKPVKGEFQEYRKGEIRKLEIKLRNDPVFTTAELNSILTKAINLLKSGDNDGFGNLAYDFYELKNTLSETQNEEMKLKFKNAVRANWKPEYTTDENFDSYRSLFEN